MSSKEEKMEEYRAQLEELGESINEKMLEEIVDGLGPANYNADASLVACSDEDELKRVFKNYVADELDTQDEEEGMQAINDVCDQMSDHKRKHRAVFYYLLAKMLK